MMAEGGLGIEHIVDSTLQCSMCLDIFTDPKGLPCLHAFCLKCLKQYVESRQSTVSFPCPQCNRNTIIPKDDVTNFPSYFILNSLLPYAQDSDTRKANQRGKQNYSNIPCPDASDCGCGELNSLCKTCSMWLCKSCTQAHTKIPILAKHNIWSNQDVTEKCKSVAKDWKERILTLKAMMDSRINLLKKGTGELDTEFISVAQSINTTADSYVSQIEKSRKKLLDEVQSCYDSKLTFLQGWISEIEDLRKGLVVHENHLNSMDFANSYLNHKTLLSAVDFISTQYGLGEESSQLPDNSKLSSEAFKGTLPMLKFKASEGNPLHYGIGTLLQNKDSDGVLTSSLHQERLQSNSRYVSLSRTPIKKCDSFLDWMKELVEDSKGYEHKFIDSHCHIDFIYKRLKLNAQRLTYTQFRRDNEESWPVNYEGCVAVFSKPYGFIAEQSDERLVLNMLQRESQGVWFALGCHPKAAHEFTKTHKKGLCELLRNTSRVVALGEIGLDYSNGFNQYKSVQRKVFREQLHIAVAWHLPIVIHCREAHGDCLDILQEIVPREHKIHAHCFMQNWEVAEKWMNLFPNLYIGLTPVISYRTALAPIDTARSIPLNRLLLETNAPYFVPWGSFEGAPEHSHPGFALCTAQLVARYQGVSVDQVLKACRENTRNMYGI